MKQIITLPGLIDIHVHLRDPGQTHKEDFASAGGAALAGGYTAVFDMPNNALPITTAARLKDKLAIAEKAIRCDVGFYFGSLGDNLDVFEQIIEQVAGLKIYLNVTTGNYKIDTAKLIDIYKAWPGSKPILLHAEDDVSDLVFKVLKEVPKPTHICHISSKEDLEFVMAAKDKGLPITCGVTPHHLLLSDRDAERLGPYGFMKPLLKPMQHQKFMWDHMDAIDVFESDHAPHTREEKDSHMPPFGVPGIETMLPLMLTAEQEGRLSRVQLIDRMHHNPARLLGLSPPGNNQVDVSLEEYEIKNSNLKTKAGWSPFEGKRVVGKVIETRLRGITVFKNGQILAKPGSGRII
jgi:dihydroorotase-like cyclic amidohydrolase